MTFHPDQLPDLSGKVYIVTGGTGGIGYYTVARLAEHGAHVYLCARTEEKGRKAIEGIHSIYPNTRLSVLVMDHTSLSTVLDAVKHFQSKETVLHGLVNNAGIMAVPFQTTTDGNEIQWQTNYLAHWVLTAQLMPLMLNTSKTLPSGSVRVVNVTSGGHMMSPKPGIVFADPGLPKESAITRYGQSKLANILHARTLNAKYGPGAKRNRASEGEIWSSSYHPGVVQTGLDDKALEMPMFMRVATFVIQAVGQRWPADKAAWTNAFLVASPDMREVDSGAYFERIAKLGSLQSAKSKSMQIAGELEKWTEKEMKRQGWV